MCPAWCVALGMEHTLTILVVTHRGDNAAPAKVMEAVRHRGGVVRRLDSDLFPTAVRLEFDPVTDDGTLGLPSERVPLRSLQSVWVRRLAVGHALPRADMGVSERRACIAESRLSLVGMIDALDAPVLGRPAAVTAASDKIRQLRTAARAGLRVPETCISNDASGVARLARRNPEGLVAKMLHAFEIPGPDGPRVVHTTRVAPADLDELDGLAAAPMVFQQAIDARREIRAVVIGERVLAAALPRDRTEPVDWRRSAFSLGERWSAVALPESVERDLVRLTGWMGLAHGSIDLLEDAEGRIWFLELNPAGEWLWLEDVAGLDISGAIADALVSGVGDPR